LLLLVVVDVIVVFCCCSVVVVVAVANYECKFDFSEDRKWIKKSRKELVLNICVLY